MTTWDLTASMALGDLQGRRIDDVVALSNIEGMDFTLKLPDGRSFEFRPIEVAAIAGDDTDKVGQIDVDMALTADRDILARQLGPFLDDFAGDEGVVEARIDSILSSPRDDDLQPNLWIPGVTGADYDVEVNVSEFNGKVAITYHFSFPNR